jgi:hypothetical protein
MKHMLRRLWGVLGLGVLLAFVVSSFVSVVYAEGPQSPNYRFDETSIGAGGFVQSSSTSYRADAASGDLAIGNSASTNYQVEAGSKTTDEPHLTRPLQPRPLHSRSRTTPAMATPSKSWATRSKTAAIACRQ